MEVEDRFMGVDEVASQLGVSRSYAYRIIRKMNDELKSAGHFVLPGKVSTAFFKEKFFGVPELSPSVNRKESTSDSD